MNTKSASPAVIRALDLGWGYAKFSRKNAVDELEFVAIPSLAPRHVGVDMSMSIIGKRDTKIVRVEGTEYEVGPDSGDLDSGDSTRNLNDQYIYTDQYKAVFYGALAYMAEPEIDLLVVGLPLSSMSSAPKLKELMVGTHKINDTTTVVVKDALVIPQALGGLYYCLSHGEKPEFEFLKEEVNLVVDPGFLTFDFILSNGDKVIENRSNAHVGGVSKVLRAICETLSAKFGIKYDNLSAVDKGLRRRKIKINGEIESLEEHITNTKSAVEGSVNYMKNIVGDGADIDNIILLGGGAHIYKKTIEKFYPKHKILLVDDPQMANVRGFQMAGEAITAKAK